MAKTKAVLDIPVSWGDLSIGEESCRLGVGVPRQHLSLGKADAQLCGKRLVGKITSVPGNDNPDQQQMPGMDDACEIPGVFDVKRVSFNKKFLSFGLTFALESVTLEALSHFPKRSGRITITEITAIPAEKTAGAAPENAGGE